MLAICLQFIAYLSHASLSPRHLLCSVVCIVPVSVHWAALCGSRRSVYITHAQGCRVLLSERSLSEFYWLDYDGSFSLSPLALGCSADLSAHTHFAQKLSIQALGFLSFLPFAPRAAPKRFSSCNDSSDWLSDWLR